MENPHDAPAPAPSPRPRAEPSTPTPGVLCILLIVALLSLLIPPGWAKSPNAPWVPATGVAVALTVWAGYRAAILLLPAALLAAVCGWAMSAGYASLAEALGLGLYDGVWQAILVGGSIWTYRRLFQGEVDLAEPRSASCFLLAPLLVCAVVALLRDLPGWLIAPTDINLLDTAARAIGLVLGIVVLAPPLLVCATPWLIRRGLIGGDGWWKTAASTALPALGLRARRFTRGDEVEIVSLVTLTTLMSVLLTLALDPQNPGAWQLWGVPLLLVVWAGVRQGRHGATLTAGVSCAASLITLAIDNAVLGRTMPLQLQGNLIALCAVALLAAASVNWVRASEQRYRQVVSQIPVVLYSTRLRQVSPSNQVPHADVLFINPPAQGVFGCTVEELLGDHQRWLNRVHPDDREILQAALMQLARQSQPVVCEYRLAPSGEKVGKRTPMLEGDKNLSPLPQASFRWVRDVMVPQLDELGRLIGWEGMASDITEQRILADDLRRTTSMFHALVANLPAGVFFVSARSGRPILVNQRARQLLGQREDAAAGLEHLATVYRLHRADGTPYPASELPVAAALERGTPSMRDDIVVHRPDGRKIPLISWGAPVNLGQGTRTDAVVWVFEDLTELRQAEAARRETEGRLRTVIESLAEGLLVQDRQEEIIDCNRSGWALLGRLLESPQSLPEAGWLREDGAPLPPDEHPIRRVLRLGTPVRNVVLGLVRSETPDVRTRWLLINALPLAARAGKAAGVVTTLVDLTEHIHAEKLIRTSEERYRELVDSLPLMLAQLDRDLNLTRANPTLLTSSGYAFDEIRASAAWQRLIHPDDLTALTDALAAALTGQSGRLECRYRDRNGQEHICLVFVVPIRETSGQGTQVVGITTLSVDLTRERRLELELQRAQRLELVGRLSSGIAHDFNNLLTALLGLTRLAQDKVEAAHPLVDDLRQIEDVGEQATHLAQQILGFCKQRPTPLRPIEVNRATRRIADIVRTLLPTEIQLDCALAHQDLHVMADEIQLQQVVMNLCLNARDAMPGGGQLRVRTAPAPANWVCLSVEDTGEGMNSKVQQQIFEPFFSTKERGSGLGLAVVHQILTSFGGRIEVQSDVGKGSRFEVWLPRIAGAVS